MSSLIFPDVNVWLALLVEGHLHRDRTLAWWESVGAERIGFHRVTQMAFLRLLTNAVVMYGKPLTMDEAWHAYDRAFEDDRVFFAEEPPQVEIVFRRVSAGRVPSPKLWADHWLIAFAEAAGGTLVTFDRALAARSKSCTLLDA